MISSYVNRNAKGQVLVNTQQTIILLIYLIFQETKCVVFTFDTKSKECKLYEDKSGGDVEADDGFMIGFCPKPDPKYATEVPTSNAKLQWWCYRGKETLCYLPYAPGVFEPLDCGFTNGKCCENSVGHKDFASPCKSQSIITFFVFHS